MLTSGTDAPGAATVVWPASGRHFCGGHGLPSSVVVMFRYTVRDASASIRVRVRVVLPLEYFRMTGICQVTGRGVFAP